MDRRVSFAGYAYDNFFEIRSEEAQSDDFKLNHFYDEPSPELLQK